MRTRRPSIPLSPGQILHNRYRIAKLIGQGGFGAVYRAWDTALNQPCAIKENLDTSAAAQRQFQREASMLAGLRHPNLPRVTDHFFIPGQGQYLVMDFVEGQSLDTMLTQRGQPLNEQDVLPWIEQVCDALTYLHSHNPPIIHRDIKPQNIIITPTGQVMLVDFGISKIYDTQLSTTVGARGVTPGFSPPEQYGQGRTDARSDVYALGATLYTLLAAQVPPDAIDRLVHHVPLTPPRQLRPQISARVEQVTLKALEPAPDRRFQNANEFRDALRKQTPAISTQLVVRGDQVPRWLWGILAGVLLLIVFFIAFWSRKPASTPTATPRIAVVAVGTPTGTPTPNTIATAQAEAPPTPTATDTPTPATQSPTLTPSSTPTVSTAGDTIKIGALAPLSAPGSVTGGTAMKAAFEVAVEDINAAGGVLGKPVELVLVDTEGLPERGTAAMERLISQEKVVAVVGEYHSAVGLTAKEVAHKDHVPTVFAETWNDKITAAQYPEVFRIAPVSSEVAAVDAKFIQSLGAKNVVIMTENTGYGIPAAESTTERLADLGIEATTFSADIGTQDFSGIIERIKAANPELILVLLTGETSYNFEQQAAEAGIGPQDVAMICNQVADDSETFWTNVPDGNLCFYRRIGLPRALYTDETTAFVQKYTAKTGKASAESYAMEAYDSLKLMAQAINEAGSTDADAIISALENISYDGALGNITFTYGTQNPIPAGTDAKWWHQFPKPAITMVQYQEKGQDSASAAVVYPEAYKTADPILP